MAKPKKKEVDYRSGSALLKKQLAERSGKPVVLPSKKKVVSAAKQIGGAALVIAGPGKAVKGVQAVVKAAKSAKAAKAAEKTTKGLPKAPTVKNPPKPPMGTRQPQSAGSKAIENMKTYDAKKAAQKKANLAEDRKRLAQMAKDKAANKPKPTQRGSFSGDLARYNWTGK